MRRNSKSKRRRAEAKHIRVKTAFLPVLERFIEYGENEETRIAASLALNDWNEPANRMMWMSWGLESGYLKMFERACQDIPTFKKVLRVAPQTEIERCMNAWVLEAAQLITSGKGVSSKKVRKTGKDARKNTLEGNRLV